MNTDTLIMTNTFGRACRYMSYMIDGIFSKFTPEITGLYVIDSCFVSDNSTVGMPPKPSVNMSIDMNGNNGEPIEVIVLCDFYIVDDFNWNVKVFNATKQICDEVAYSALDVIDIIKKYVKEDYDDKTE